jgi:hypothetical protein
MKYSYTSNSARVGVVTNTFLNSLIFVGDNTNKGAIKTFIQIISTLVHQSCKLHLRFIMIILEDEQEIIIDFITDSIKDFRTQQGKFNSIGIYCCPWAGWISTSFNVEKSIHDTSYNCPDFDIVGFKYLELEK